MCHLAHLCSFRATAQHQPSPSGSALSRLRLAERRMVEVRGVEPLSEMASPERLRVYLAFNLGRSTPTKRAYPQPSVRFGTLQRPSGEPCSVICYIMPRRSADIGASTCGLLLRRQERNRCSQLLFLSFFTWPTRIHDAQPDFNSSRRNRITPKMEIKESRILPKSQWLLKRGSHRLIHIEIFVGS